MNIAAVDGTIQMLHQDAHLFSSRKEAERVLKTMISQGEMYNHLESRLGTSVCFVLGTRLSESQ